LLLHRDDLRPSFDPESHCHARSAREGASRQSSPPGHFLFLFTDTVNLTLGVGGVIGLYYVRSAWASTSVALFELCSLSPDLNEAIERLSDD
jgi:hypothetical protein